MSKNQIYHHHNANERFGINVNNFACILRQTACFWSDGVFLPQTKEMRSNRFAVDDQQDGKCKKCRGSEESTDTTKEVAK